MYKRQAKCTAVYVEVGDTVRAGQALCTLDLASTLSSYEAANIGYTSAVQSYQDQAALFDKQIALYEKNVNDLKALQEIGAGDKPVYLVFNKVDAYTYIEKEEDDLTPATRENLSLEELKKSWIARANTPCIFLSALAKTNLEKFRSDLYGMVREIHAGRYPFNNFLY